MNPTPAAANARRLDSRVMFGYTGMPLRVMRIPSHGAYSAQHTHDFHELVVIVDGHGRHEVDDEAYDLEAGDVFVILGDTSHGYPETESLSLINILFDPEQLLIPQNDLADLPGFHALFSIEPQLKTQGKFRNHLRLSTAELGYVSELVSELEEELTARKPAYQFMAVGHLMRLMGYLSRCYSDVQLDRTRPVAQISRLLSFLNSNYRDPLSVADLMAVAHMSQTSLMRTFGEITGRSPIDYLIRLRISRAAELLRSSEMSVTEIAAAVGFEDSNYLTRQFKRIRGVSPRAYRTRRAG